MSPFYWGRRQERAAKMLAEGQRQTAVAEAVGVTARTVQRWLASREFVVEVDRLTLLTGMSNRAERVRQAKRMVAMLGDSTHRDLLDWLKYLQSETDGAKLDADFVEQVMAAISATRAGEPNAPVAGGATATAGGASAGPVDSERHGDGDAPGAGQVRAP